MSKSSIVTADNELKHAPTVPRLAAKILHEDKKLISLRFHIKINVNKNSPRHEESHKEFDMTKRVHHIERYELINLIDAVRHHWIAVLVVREHHQTDVKIHQSDDDKANDWNYQRLFCFAEAF